VRTLDDNRLAVVDEAVVFRFNENIGEFRPFANNPYPAPRSNADGNFVFAAEPRFPLFEREVDANGHGVLDANGLQIWKPLDVHRGMNVAFEAALSTRDAAEQWSGRELPWGDSGRMEMDTHAFVDFNAFYSPAAKALFFGVVPYRLAGQPARIFEIASSWDMASHESGHALHHVLKPNVDVSDPGFRTWGENFGDQMSMWASLRDPSRVESLLAETNDLTRSNPLSALGEAFAALVGQGTGVRDAVNDKRVSDTDAEVHDRSEVFTGAAYKFFLNVLGGMKTGNPQRALMDAGDVMGTFAVRATDYVHENFTTLEEVAQAYLKVDKEFYRGRYHGFLVDEFTRREIFGVNSVPAWFAHEAAIPKLQIRRRASDRDIDSLIQTNLEQLGIGLDFGLALQSVTRDRTLDQTIVKVQLTLGRGSGAELLNAHGVLVFRENGTLSDYHDPLPSPTSGDSGPQTAQRMQLRLRPLIAQAKQIGLDKLGVPLSIARRADGTFSVEARVLRGSGMNAHADVFSLERPQGERREVITPVMPRSRVAVVPEALAD
jgi:hypothetical protein